MSRIIIDKGEGEVVKGIRAVGSKVSGIKVEPADSDSEFTKSKGFSDPFNGGSTKPKTTLPLASRPLPASPVQPQRFVAGISPMEGGFDTLANFKKRRDSISSKDSNFQSPASEAVPPEDYENMSFDSDSENNSKPAEQTHVPDVSAPTNKPERAMTYEEIQKQKLYILYYFDRLEKRGYKIHSKFSLNDDLEAMQDEFDRLRKQIEIEKSIRFSRKALIFFVTGIEKANDIWGPRTADNKMYAKLDGWSEAVSEQITDYDDVFEQLYEKYGSALSEWPPEIKLIFMVGGSACMFHISQTMAQGGFDLFGGPQQARLQPPPPQQAQRDPAGAGGATLQQQRAQLQQNQQAQAQQAQAQAHANFFAGMREPMPTRITNNGFQPLPPPPQAQAPPPPPQPFQPPQAPPVATTAVKRVMRGPKRDLDAIRRNMQNPSKAVGVDPNDSDLADYSSNSSSEEKTTGTKGTGTDTKSIVLSDAKNKKNIVIGKRKTTR